MSYKIIDEITDEILEFDNQMDAEIIAQRRLNRHKSGYNMHNKYISPVSNAIIKIEGRIYTICTE